MANQGVKQASEDKGFFKEAYKATAEQIDLAGAKVEALKELASQNIADGINDARRLARHGRYAVEDYIEETSHLIKRDPLRSVGITLGIGLGLGALIGYLIGHKARTEKLATEDCRRRMAGNT